MNHSSQQRPLLSLTQLSVCSLCVVLCCQSAGAGVNWSRELQQLKGSLSDLVISEALYMQYCNTSAEQQTVKEFVSCRMYEVMERETRNREALNIEMQQLTQQLVRAESEMERVRGEKEQISRSKRLSAPQSSPLSPTHSFTHTAVASSAAQLNELCDRTSPPLTSCCLTHSTVAVLIVRLTQARTGAERRASGARGQTVLYTRHRTTCVLYQCSQLTITV